MNFFSKAILFSAAGGLSLRTPAVIFNTTYDASVTNSAYSAQIQSAFGAATSYLQSVVTNNVTVNLAVYWGAVGPFSGGVGLGESQFTLLTNTYAQITNALRNARTSEADSNAVASLPATDPAAGKIWKITTVQAKVFGGFGLAATDTNLDGSVGFSPAYAYAFDPANRAVTNAYDFIGVAIHEITEVMGRSDEYLDGNFMPYDLFRFSAPGVRTLNAAATVAYFSVDNGVTNLRNFNTNSAGDFADWAVGGPKDCCDWQIFSNKKTALSYADLVALDVVGFGVNYHPPKLASFTQGANFVTTYTSVPGTTYTIFTTTNLTPAITNWTILTTNNDNGTPGQFSFTNPVPGTSALRFYRLKLN